MKDEFSEAFIDALINNNLTALRKIPKADLHNHFTLGGNREYIRKISDIDIPFLMVFFRPCRICMTGILNI